MAFTDLPPELRLVIAEFLDARSCLPFTLTSRQHHDLCASLLRTHKELSSRYYTLEASNTGRIIWKRTKEVILNPKLAQYIEYLCLPANRQQTWDEDQELNIDIGRCPPQLSEDMVQLYVQGAKDTPIASSMLKSWMYTPGIYFGDWTMEAAIRAGSDAPVCTILVSRLSHLRYFGFSAPDNHLFELLVRVARAYGDPTRVRSLPFQHLTHVAMACVEDPCSRARWAKVILALPSLRGFAARVMGGTLDEPSHLMDIGGPSASNVEELIFLSSFFDPAALKNIFSRTKALKSFAYESGGSTVSMDGCFAPRAVTAGLLQYATHSLEHLIFTRDESMLDHAEIDFVSWNGFQRLKSLRCRWATLFGEEELESAPESLPEGQFYTDDEPDVVDLAGRLPLSLEALHLDDPIDKEYAQQSVSKMVRECANCLPNLKQVYVTATSRDWVEGLRDALTEKGLQFKKLPEPSMDNYLVQLLNRLPWWM